MGVHVTVTSVVGESSELGEMAGTSLRCPQLSQQTSVGEEEDGLPPEGGLDASHGLDPDLVAADALLREVVGGRYSRPAPMEEKLLPVVAQSYQEAYEAVF